MVLGHFINVSFHRTDLATSGLYYKSLSIVIYDRNGNTIVEPLL
jgi:hypothetical protein